MHRIRTTAWTHASERNIHHRDSPTATPPVVRTPAPLDPSRPVEHITRHRKDKEKQLPAQSAPALAHHVSDHASSATSSDPPSNTQEHGEKATTLAEEPKDKPGLGQRMKAGSFRFVEHTKDALFHSWINVLLIFVPVGIAVNFIPLPESTHSTITFAMNAVAIIPLAGLLAHATESVASRMGDTWASLLNVTFGNAVELIIFIIALIKNEISIVQASILGSILANLLLILGMAFLFGGLRYQEQIYNSTVTQMSACLLSLAVISLLLPTAFHASFSDGDYADSQTIKISRGTSVILLIVYILYLLFQLRSHAYMYESTPQQVIDEETVPGMLADFLDSSSSDSSDTSSSSDSDSSLGSHTTTRKRIKKAISKRMRRKSNASSVQTASASVPSVISSPVEKRSISSVGPGTPQEGYFDVTERQRRESHAASFSLPPVFSDNEADYDADIDPNAPRVRDFETEQPKSADPKRKVKKYKQKIRKYKQQKHEQKHMHEPLEQVDEAATPQPLNEQYNEPQVSFADGTADDNAPMSSSKRPFAGRALTRAIPAIPRPPLPNVFTNTVFSQQQQLQLQQQQQQHHNMAAQPSTFTIPRSGTGTLRRTSSLPNMAGKPQAARGQSFVQPAMQPARSNLGQLVQNQADAIRKDRQDDGEKPTMSRTAAIVLLLISTGLVAFCAELMVDAIPGMIATSNVSQAFIGLIILPIVGNAAEHVTAVSVAVKNKMDLAIGVAVGSSIQIALFVTPLVTLIGWFADIEMSLYFNIFETVALFVTVFVVNFLVLDGRSNYLEGSLLIAAYVIIAVAAFFYPAANQESAVGGGGAGGSSGFA